MATDPSPTLGRQLRWGALSAFCAAVFYMAVVVSAADSPGLGAGFAAAGLFGLFAAAHNGEQVRRRHIAGGALIGAALVVSLVSLFVSIAVNLPDPIGAVIVHLYAAATSYSAAVTAFDMSATLYAFRSQAPTQ